MAASKDLAEILSKRNAEKYKSIIERASLNGYHDHKFENIPGHAEYANCICPKMQLVEDLNAFPELSDIQQQVIDGVYDDPADAEDQAEMRLWLMDDNAPNAMFAQLGFDIPTEEERQQHQKRKLLN